MKKKTWYYKSGSKKAELWTILHLPYTVMCLSFLLIGFSIQKPINWLVLLGAIVSYFCGLGIAAHALDQLPGMGSSYVKFLSKKELLSLGIISLIIALGIGAYFIVSYQMWHMMWLMPLQGFFAVAYPVSKLFKGFFHNDFWFSVGFGFMPVVVGYYANTLSLSFSWVIIPFGLLCFLIAAIEITLSRYVRKLRAEETTGLKSISYSETTSEYIMKPERALKLLCLLSYVLAGVILLL